MVIVKDILRTNKNINNQEAETLVKPLNGYLCTTQGNTMCFNVGYSKDYTTLYFMVIKLLGSKTVFDNNELSIHNYEYALLESNIIELDLNLKTIDRRKSTNDIVRIVDEHYILEYFKGFIPVMLRRVFSNNHVNYTPALLLDFNPVTKEVIVSLFSDKLTLLKGSADYLVRDNAVFAIHSLDYVYSCWDKIQQLTKLSKNIDFY